MRKFYLENGTGNRVRLNAEDGIFLHEPKGLGFEFDHDYAGTGSGFYFRNKFSASQTPISGELMFLGSDKKTPYTQYREFVKWIYSDDYLYFVYAPEEVKEYYRRIDVASIDKSELDEYGVLNCDISFTTLTPWYEPIPMNVDFTDESEDAMAYRVEIVDGVQVEGFIYDEHLIYGVGAKDYSADIEPTGDMPASVKVTYNGFIINPVFRLTSLITRKVIGECGIYDEFDANSTIVLSTAEQDSYIKYIDENGEEHDLLDLIDITTNPFFRIPASEPCELSISGESMLGTANMKVFMYYRGV